MELSMRAHAKINVFLRVLGSRDDGYHEIESLITQVSLHDRVTVRESGSLSLTITGEHAPDLSGESGSSGNSAMAAALALREESALTEAGAEIVLEKRVPVAAGLGGGSSDAAAVLKLLNELWSCGLNQASLREVGARVGADVPAMLADEPVLIRGRGEDVTPVMASPMFWALKPLPFPVSASDAYAWWDQDPSTGQDPGALIAAAETGDLELVGDAMFDDLQAPVASRHPRIEEIVHSFRLAGAHGAIMSGSGPTVVALARDAAHAQHLADAVPGSFVVSFPPVSSG
jgi:4-diphosphocytidyl-2-C-methyl-D-erythritol kinase